jgi:MFS family permease
MQNTGAHFDDETATLFLSIPNFVSIVGSPFFGRMVDRKGRALVLIFAASCMMIVGHVVFFALAVELISISPVIIMIWLGLGYSMGAASLWPILSIVVEEQMLSTAYGTMTAVQNAGLAIFPLIIGQLQDANGIKGTKLQYTLPIMIFIGCAFVAIFLTLILIRVDKTNNGGLMNASSTERAARKKLISDQKKKLLESGANGDSTSVQIANGSN